MYTFKVDEMFVDSWDEGVVIRGGPVSLSYMTYNLLFLFGMSLLTGMAKKFRYLRR
jgi:hypothetical protein